MENFESLCKLSKDHFPVKCKAGVIADAANGRRLVWDDESNMYAYSDIPSRYIKKKTLSTVYKMIVTHEKQNLLISISAADHIDRRGMNWSMLVLFKVTANNVSLMFCSKDVDLNYWLTGKGAEILLAAHHSMMKDWKSVVEQFIVSNWDNLRLEIFNRENLNTILDLLVSWNTLKRKMKNYDPLTGWKFGIEIEFTGLTRKDAADIVASYFNTVAVFAGGYHITDSKRRLWKIISDGSITPCLRNGQEATDQHKCELVTPICEYSDIKDIQQIVRNLRHKGMCVNNSCGIHVHVDGSRLTAFALCNLVNIMAAKEKMIFKALGTYTDRINRYCQTVDTRFLKEINESNTHIVNLEFVKNCWYHGHDHSSFHYDFSRYRAINLHSLWQQKGVEFRMFNSTTHAGKIKAYIQLCLGLCNYASTLTKKATPNEHTTSNEKSYFRTWLYTLGLEGDRYKTARLHLLANLKNENERIEVA